MKRKIAVIASSRATYGYKRRLIGLIEKSPKLELQLIVTGMHLLHEYGYSVQDIVSDGYSIAARVEMMVGGDTASAWAKSLGVEIQNLAQVFSMLKPDIVLVTGDRAEMFAASVTAAYMSIPVAHIQAGDLSGHIDGSARHAITKLSHIHLPSCEDSAERVKKMGEEEWRIFNVGAPQLDDIVKDQRISREELSGTLNIDFSKPVLVVVQHPVLTEIAQVSGQIRATMEAVKNTGYSTIVIYPNVDAAGREIIAIIREYERLPQIHVFSNLSRKRFLSVLAYAGVLIGNSSAGILEAPSFKLPAINIGTRQKGRMRAVNVIDVEQFDRASITDAIEKALGDEEYRLALNKCVNPYGDGHSSERICKILEEIDLHQFREKMMTY